MLRIFPYLSSFDSFTICHKILTNFYFFLKLVEVCFSRVHKSLSMKSRKVHASGTCRRGAHRTLALPLFSSTCHWTLTDMAEIRIELLHCNGLLLRSRLYAYVDYLTEYSHNLKRLHEPIHRALVRIKSSKTQSDCQGASVGYWVSAHNCTKL